MNTFRFNFKLGPDALLESIKLGYVPPKSAWIRYFSQFSEFCRVVGLVVMVLGIFFLFGGANAGLPVSVILGGFIGLAGASLISFVGRRVMSEYVTSVLDSHFLRNAVTWDLSSDGIRFQNDDRDWMTNWSAIDDVLPGKEGITIKMAGMVFALPRAVIESETDYQAFYEQLTKWHKAAQ